ncbi:zinc finger protein OBI1-like [Dunckerocampus dactyliophorus]|uniref:zinc finger protein OBI1-like n=1 Tax=Dunckerocampus dactyliophorus TaxID=161453 RepID=UPI00240592B3|nr:zinc finger protein OBI1-like [Dunckerocampus dactyliophorus]
MCYIQKLRTLVQQRVNTVVEEIFGLFERTIAEYEEELSRTKKENKRQRELLNAVFKPSVRLHREDIQRVSVESHEVVPSEQQEWNSSVGQESEPRHIKEEEPWEQLHGLEKADITKFTFIGVPVKSGHDEAQSSQLHHCHSEENRQAEPLIQHMTTDDDGERCGGPQADRDFAPLSDMDDMMSDSSETDHSDDTTEHLESNKDSKGDMRHHADNKHFDCSECEKSFGQKAHFIRHMKTHTGEKPFACSVCAKRFSLKEHMKKHMMIHTGEKPFSCSVCSKGFRVKYEMMRHMKTHTGEKQFTCSVCMKSFSRKDYMIIHRRTHTGGHFSCSLCPKRFSCKRYVMIHMRTHSGEKPFSCDACDRSFTYKYQVNKHKCAGAGS